MVQLLQDLDLGHEYRVVLGQRRLLDGLDRPLVAAGDVSRTSDEAEGPLAQLFAHSVEVAHGGLPLVDKVRAPDADAGLMLRVDRGEDLDRGVLWGVGGTAV